MLYADIVVDISHEKLDKVFQYQVPEQWQDSPGLLLWNRRK